ncbi:aldehyde dehydrogenase family protein [Mycobacterium sp. MS1601]|uniref:aldehyde dehydrogenase family protein n=1 Tax=Mycobacterium sp. MS1601 TaxID=1936029 RepID=UPI0030020B62
MTPSTSPVAALYFKVLSAMLTRNAVVISPHPAVRRTCVEAANVLAVAAVEAGAPQGAIQVIERPTVPLIENLMGDSRVNLILATGGGAVVSAAYHSGTPAIGVGPGNPPVLVDATADVPQAASDIIESKSFDNSVLCTAESLLLAVDSIADRLEAELVRNGGYICTPDETEKIRAYVYPGGRFNTKVVGRSAAAIAESAGFRVGTRVKVLITPIQSVVDEEPLTHEKLSPILAMLRVPDVARAIRDARSLLRIAGTGHSAVIHSNNPNVILEYSKALSAHRISVNVPGSKGNAGMGTTLPMSLSVGTGFRGGSSTGDNLTPDHLVQWSVTAFSQSTAVRLPDFDDALRATVTNHQLAAPAYPVPSNLGETATKPTHPATRTESHPTTIEKAELRDELRAIVFEELRNLIGTR